MKNSKYQWPADKITQKEMAMLYRMKKKTGLSINELLRKCVKNSKKINLTFGQTVYISLFVNHELGKGHVGRQMIQNAMDAYNGGAR